MSTRLSLVGGHKFGFKALIECTETLVKLPTKNNILKLKNKSYTCTCTHIDGTIYSLRPSPISINELLLIDQVATTGITCNL